MFYDLFLQLSGNNYKNVIITVTSAFLKSTGTILILLIFKRLIGLVIKGFIRRSVCCRFILALTKNLN